MRKALRGVSVPRCLTRLWCAAIPGGAFPGAFLLQPFQLAPQALKPAPLNAGPVAALPGARHERSAGANVREAFLLEHLQFRARAGAHALARERDVGISRRRGQRQRRKPLCLFITSRSNISDVDGGSHGGNRGSCPLLCPLFARPRWESLCRS